MSDPDPGRSFPSSLPSSFSPSHPSHYDKETELTVNILNNIFSTYPSIPPSDDDGFLTDDESMDVENSPAFSSTITTSTAKPSFLTNNLEKKLDSSIGSPAVSSSENAAGLSVSLPSNVSFSNSNKSSSSSFNRKRSSNSIDSSASSLINNDSNNTNKLQKTSLSFSISEASLFNKYERDAQGPFDVVILSNDNSPLHPLTISKLITGTYELDVIEIKKMGFSKILVQLKSSKSGNSFVNYSALKNKSLIAFIPSFRTHRQGIIRDVPLDLSIEEGISRELISPFEISSVRRLNRRISDPGNPSG